MDSALIIDRGESILDEVMFLLKISFLDTRRPFRMTRATEVKNRFSEQKNKTIDCDLKTIFIFINLAIYYIYTIYTDISKPVRAVDSFRLYITC